MFLTFSFLDVMSFIMFMAVVRILYGGSAFPSNLMLVLLLNATWKDGDLIATDVAAAIIFNDKTLFERFWNNRIHAVAYGRLLFFLRYIFDVIVLFVAVLEMDLRSVFDLFGFHNIDVVSITVFIAVLFS